MRRLPWVRRNQTFTTWEDIHIQTNSRLLSYPPILHIIKYCEVNMVNALASIIIRNYVYLKSLR